ncbi:MAG: class I SAM-dependent methyltransferase [Pseudomonadales bacterium]
MSRRETWNARYATKELIWSAGPNTLFAETVKSLTPGHAIDAACGEGRNALWLAEQGWSVTAIDFSDVAIDKGRQIAARRALNIEWVTADLTELSLPRDSCDLLAILYLHTAPDERQIWLPNLISTVRSGGSFVYIGHDPSNIEHGVGGPQDAALLPGVDALCAALPGFRIQRAEVVSRTVDSDPGHTDKAHNESAEPGAGPSIALDTFVHAIRA